jgi:hypothetical protein
VLFVAAGAVAVLTGGVVAVVTDQATPSTAAPATTTSTSTSSTSTSTTLPPTTAAPTTTSTTAPPGPVVPGALAPVVAGEEPTAALEPVALADQILQAELAIRDPASPPEVLAAAGRLQQVAYRRLADNPAWEPEVFARTPVELHGAPASTLAKR